MTTGRHAIAATAAVLLAACGDLPRPAGSELIESSDDLYSARFLPSFRISLDEPAMRALDESPFEYVEGEFRYGPYILKRVGVRLKGSATFETLDKKPAFKIRFDWFDSDQRFFGLEAITLNNLEQDPTMVREHLGYRLFRAAGVPAPRTSYAQVVLNQELLGLYVTVETPNDQFLARHFADPSGGLYEGDYGDDLHPTHVWRFEQDEGDDAERDDLLEFTLWVHEPTDAIFYAEQTLLDTEEFLSFGAAEAVLGHWDGYWIAHNYRIYHEPTLDEWSFIPWGIDQILRKRIEPFDQLSYLYRRCRESARCLPDYIRRTREVIELFEQLDLEAEYERIAAFIDEPARNDPRKSFTDQQMDRNREILVEYVRERPDELRAMLDCVDAAGEHELDVDGDGFGRCYADCDDDDPDVNPDADELCDGIDNDCSGNVDDNLSCGCPDQEIDGVTFHFCDLSMSWESAATWCAQLGLSLASIHDDARNRAVWEAAREAREGPWWIGLSDVGREQGDFYWIDGSPVDYTAWKDGEPNFDGVEHCVQLRTGEPEWMDLACGNARPFVCRAE